MDGPADVGLRRQLSIWEAIGISVALMAPSMAANINPQGTAGSVGRAVPLAFALATVGVLLVAHTFVRLTQQFHHSGSVYGFVGATLGARPGVVAGWALLGTYTFYGVVTASAAGIFGIEFLSEVGLWDTPPEWATYLLIGLALAGVYALVIVPARGGTRALLVIEGVTVGLILLITAVVLVKLLAGNAPDGQEFDLDVFTVPPGTDTSALFLGIVFGFLSFAGFEAAATLGEEARHPRRDIPRAILGTAIFGGVYFVVVTAVEVMGFGTDADGVAAFSVSPSLLGDLGSAYVADWVGEVVTLGTAISAFGCSLACAVGATRILYALCRDGVGPRSVAALDPRRGTPYRAAQVLIPAMAVIVLVDWLAFGAEPFDVFLWSATIGTLVLIFAYLVTVVGAIRFLFLSGQRLAPAWEIVVPIAAIAVLGYTLWRNVWPYPEEGAAQWLPVVCAVWVLVGVAIVLARPAASRRAGELLTQSEGLSRAGAADSAPQPRP
jgi:amino acid transporter